MVQVYGAEAVGGVCRVAGRGCVARDPRGARALRSYRCARPNAAFADRATSAFASDEVQAEVGQRIAQREIAAEPELAPLRPALDAAVANAVQSSAVPAALPRRCRGDAPRAVQRRDGRSDAARHARGRTGRRSSRLARSHTASERRPGALPPRRRRARDRARRGRAGSSAASGLAPVALLVGLAAAGRRRPGGRRPAAAARAERRSGSRWPAGRSSRPRPSAAPWSSPASTPATATPSSDRSGTRSSATCGYGASSCGAVGLIAAAIFEPGARGAWPAAGRDRVGAVQLGGAAGAGGGAARTRRAAGLDARGSARSRAGHAGRCAGLQRRRRGRAFVVRSVIHTRIRLRGRRTGGTHCCSSTASTGWSARRDARTRSVRVNTAYGHPGGDRALILVADCLRGACREGDVAARLGGGAFAAAKRSGKNRALSYA